MSEPVATLRHLSPAPPSGQLSPSDSSCIIYEQLPAHTNVVPQTVTVQINYTPQPSGDGEFVGRVSEARVVREDDDGASPPTRSTPHSPPSSPLIPKRTTSIFQRFQAALTRGDTFKSYISEFPPDQEAMLSPTEEEKVEKRELPPRPSTTPLRTRSIFYNSVLSDRSTPSLPSLSHSYETLNGSDTAAENYRTPHRPAPAPPGESSSYFKSSQEGLVSLVEIRLGSGLNAHFIAVPLILAHQPRGSCARKENWLPASRKLSEKQILKFLRNCVKIILLVLILILIILCLWNCVK